MATIVSAAIGGRALEPGGAGGDVADARLALVAAASSPARHAPHRPAGTLPGGRRRGAGDARAPQGPRQPRHAPRWWPRSRSAAARPRRPSRAIAGCSTLVLEHDIDRVILAPTSTRRRRDARARSASPRPSACASACSRACSRSSAPAVEFDDVDGMTMLGVRRFGLSALLALRQARVRRAGRRRRPARCSRR